MYVYGVRSDREGLTRGMVTIMGKITIVKARVNKRFHGICHFPSKYFPYGFEFVLDELVISRAEEEDEFMWSPGGSYVEIVPLGDEGTEIVRKFGEKIVMSDVDEDGSVMTFTIAYVHCEEILGVSHFKLSDLLWMQKEEEIKDGYMNQVLSRNYTVTVTEVNP